LIAFRAFLKLGPNVKGTFDTGRSIPAISDEGSFIKGWFQHTWEELEKRLETTETIMLHHDADF
jgi:hypothetical protein